MGGQFFKGYDRLVWCVIVVNAAGGMIVGMVRTQPASPSAPQTAHDRSNGEQEYIASRQTAEGQGETREQPSTAAQDGQKEQAAKSQKDTHAAASSDRRGVRAGAAGDEVCGQHPEGFRDGDLDAALHPLLRRPLRAAPAPALPPAPVLSAGLA